MKTRTRMFAAMVALAMVTFAATAFAQNPTPGPAPTLTPTLGIVMALSMVLGILNNWIQTGTVLGRWIAPKAWLPDVTMIATALGGFLGYITSQTPVSLTGSAIFYGIMAAVGALIAGAAPSAVMHVHATLTQMRRDALKAAAAAAAKAATAIVLVFALLGPTLACSKALFPTLNAVEQTVLTDLEAGKTDTQIASDVCADLGGTAQTDAICADVAGIINAAITLLMTTGLMSPAAQKNAQAYRMGHPLTPAPAK